MLSSYVLPVKWQLRTEHAKEVCYFCLNEKNICGYLWDRRNEIKYTTVEKVLLAVASTAESPYIPSEQRELMQQAGIDADMNFEDMEYDTEPNFADFSEPHVPEPSTGAASGPSESPPSAVDSSSTFTPDRIARQLAGEKIEFTQQDVNILANEFGLTIRQKEHLGSR